MKIAYFDCFSGISGDMCLGALIDAGLDPGTLQTALKGLPVAGYSLTANRVVKQGVSAVKAEVKLPETNHQHCIGLLEITAILEGSRLPEQVKSDALRVFQRLVEAEAKVHGVSVEAAHLHEVGAVDALVDVVGTILGLYLLEISEVYASPLPPGGGTVRCSHGVLPVPAPATLELLKGIPTFPSPVQSELVTPTGAALITTLAKGFGPLPAMTVAATGYGAGDKNFPHPNVLRIIIGDQEEEVPLPLYQESVAVIEATIDDMNPEFFSHLGDKVFSLGALDYYLTPVYMKKQRPGTKVTILSEPDTANIIAGLLLMETTTLGCRIRKEQRLVAERDFVAVHTPYGSVRVKVSRETKTISPEYQDCLEVAEVAGIPVKLVYDAAKAEGWKLLQD
jgi:uncharacterized protein (TIGR00299 family) protein